MPRTELLEKIEQFPKRKELEGKPLQKTAPCGVCRQVMMEFCNPDTFRILMAVSPEEYTVYTLRQLMPEGFGPDNL